MKLVDTLLGIIFSFAILIALFFTSIEGVTYWIPGYYEQQYTKYQVTEAVDMEMDDLLDVTHEMLSYLKDDLADLHVPTIVGGESREFFNAREIAHMEDVKDLFLGGIQIRQICIIIAILSLAILFLKKANVSHTLPRAILLGSIIFFAILALIGGIIASDFSHYFIVFHELFFDNDLWLLDPRTDLLINIVPEPFFATTATLIGGTYATLVFLIMAICTGIIWKQKRSRLKGTATVLLGCMLLNLMPPFVSYAAPEWPSNANVIADGGIVMDVNSGTVIYGKNIHEQFYPASITKILTALVVLEHAEMDEIVTFSHNAVYNVESGSTNAGLDTGDQLSVKDTLYALMLKSANEAGNGLAEHIAGSNEGFSVLMNEKAKSLGCTNSNFVNPSGLNDPNHYTTAYDMALISRAAFQNEAFVEIASTIYYDLPVTKRNPDGLRIYPGHKMMKQNMEQYYPGIIGGKTGYTSLAGNTLVTCAEKNEMQLVTVVLNGMQTHYADTKELLDFGFDNFKMLNIDEYDDTYVSPSQDLSIAGLSTTELANLTLETEPCIILPNNASFTDATSSVSFDLTENAPENAIAQINYSYNDRKIGSRYLLLTDPPEPVLEIIQTEPAPPTIADESIVDESQPEASENTSSITPTIWTILSIILMIGIGIGCFVFYRTTHTKKREQIRMERSQRRQRRLEESGVSTNEFDLMLQRKRATAALDRINRNQRSSKRKSFFRK